MIEQCGTTVVVVRAPGRYKYSTRALTTTRQPPPMLMKLQKLSQVDERKKNMYNRFRCANMFAAVYLGVSLRTINAGT